MPTPEYLLRSMQQSAEHLRAMSEKMDAPWRPEGSDPRRLHNMYIRCLITAYSAKFSQLLSVLLTSVKDENYLGYALSGRALIETTATLRYYVLHQYKPLLDKPSLSLNEFKTLIDIDDRHLRGGRFNWEAFLANKYDELQSDAEAQLASSKSKQRHVAKGIIAEQVNVMTCIERWAKESPAVLVTYSLFCDLVHPNIGSAFLVASTDSAALHFCQTKGDSVGQSIVSQTLPFLSACTLKPFGDHLGMLIASIWADDELPGSQQDTAR